MLSRLSEAKMQHEEQHVVHLLINQNQKISVNNRRPDFGLTQTKLSESDQSSSGKLAVVAKLISPIFSTSRPTKVNSLI